MPLGCRPSEYGVFGRCRRLLRVVTIVTLACFFNLSIEGYLWAHAVDQDRRQRQVTREYYKNLLGLDDTGTEYNDKAKPDAGDNELQGVTWAIEQLLQKLSRAQTTPSEARHTPNNYAPVWAAIQKLRNKIDKFHKKMDKHRDKLERQGYSQSVISRHDTTVDLLGERLDAVLAVVDQLEQALELNRFDEVASLISQLRQAIRDQETAARGSDELAHSTATMKSSSLGFGGAKSAQPPGVADLQLTPETAVSSEMAALAGDLEHDSARLYTWVRNTIELVPTTGLVQGAAETMASGCGNPVDQAALLIGLLRASNVPARYVHGTVELSADQLAAWTGTENADAAVQLLSRNGIAVEVSSSGGAVGSVTLNHTWVRAWVSYAPHRGLELGAGDRWVELDPSFKEITVQRQKDVATEIGVDPVTFLRQIRSQSTIEDAESWVTHLPEGFITNSIDLWGGDVERYADANGFTTGNLYGSRSVVPKDLQILPLTLPYRVVSEVSSGPSPMAGLETSVELSLDDASGAPLLTHTATLRELAGQRLTLRFDPATADDRQVLIDFQDEAAFPVYLVSLTPSLLVDGTVVAQGQPIGMGATLDLEMVLDGPLFESERSHTPVTAGAYAAVVFDLQGVTRRSLYQHLGPLRQAAGDLAAGTVDDLDPVLGEALHTIGLSYWHQLDGLNQLAGGGLGVVVTRQPSQLVAAYEPVVTTLLGVPFEATGNRATMAVGADRITTLATSAASENGERQLHLVSALTGSVLQHSMLEQTLGGEGISTIRLLQAASKVGTRIYTFDSHNAGDIETTLTGLDPVLSGMVASSVNAGYRVTVAAEPSSYGGFEGVGWSAYDPVTGEAGMYLNRSRAAGMRLSYALTPVGLLLGADAGAYLPLVTPGIEWIELAAPIIEQTGLRYVPAVASIGHWFGDGSELDNTAFLAAGIAISGPISLIASRPSIGQVAVTPEVFSPNNDGRKDTVSISAGLSRESAWRVDISDTNQTIVKTYSGLGQTIGLTWDGQQDDGGQAGEGWYTVTFNATADGLDTPAFPVEKRVILDLTPPVVEILTPAEGDSVKGVVSVIGTAEDANFASYTLSYGEGANPTSWTTIRHDTALVIDNSLGLFNGAKNPNGPYSLRLQAEDQAGNTAQLLRALILDDPENDLEAPQVTLQVPPEGAAVSEPLTIRAHATDNQSVDQVILAIDGAAVAQFTVPEPSDLYEISFDSLTLDNGSHQVTATASDARGNQGSDQRTITTSNAIASFRASPNPFSPNGDRVDDTTSLSATLDPADDWTLVITGGTGRSFSGAGSTVLRSWDGRDASGQMQDTGEYTATLTTTGGATATIPISLERTNQPPFLAITSPGEEARIHTEVEVIGTVTDTDLDRWTLECRRLDSDQTLLIGQGTQRVLNGVLGRLDATNLRNDPYLLVLTAFDTSDQGMELSRRVYVAGERKIGNLRFTHEDLTVPIAGLPISVARTYDSLQRDQLGDFGYGWSLDFNSLDLDDSTVYQEAEVADGSGTTLMARAGGGRDVTLTLPDGRRTTFSMVLLPGGWYGQVADWQADPGVSYTLGVPGNRTERTIIALPGMTPYWYHGTVDEGFEYYDLPGYVLVSEDGTQYYINKPLLGERLPLAFPDGSARDVSRVFGKARLTSIRDKNGNSLKFTDNGITHSNGLGILIERDPVTNLITRVVDPDGRDVRYTYDDDLNLVEVSNPLNEAIRFVYSATEEHFLERIIAPDGSQPLVYNLDNQGRVVSMTDGDGNTITVAHNTGQRQEVVTDRYGNPTIFNYDETGRITSQTNALGHVIRFEYDRYGNRTKITNALGESRSFTYDSEGNKLSETDALGNTTTLRYDQNRLVATSDPLGRTTSYEYDEKGSLIGETDPLGNQTVHEYNEYGHRIRTTDAMGFERSFTRDSAGNLLSVTDAVGHQVTYTYSNSGKVETESFTRTLLDGSVETLTSTYDYDGAGRVTRATSASGDFTEVGYLGSGLFSEEFDANGNRVGYEYDSGNRVSRRIYDDGTEDHYFHDREGRLVRVVDRAGHEMSNTLDVVGRIVRTTFPDGSFIRKEFDAAGRTVAATDQLGNVTRYQYDRAGRQIKAIDALGNETVLEYDAAGQVIASTDQLGRTTRFQYDAAGRQVRITFTDGTYLFRTYDSRGKLVRLIDQAGRSTRYEYDPAGRMTRVINADGSESKYEYDEMANLVAKTDGELHTTRYEYDRLGRRTKEVLPDGSFRLWTYDGVGNVTSGTDARGRTVTYQYDSNNRLIERAYPDGSSVVFTYTPTGKQQTVSDVRGTTTYTYDARDQLVEMVPPDGRSLSYGYDQAGNRTEMTAHVGGQNVTTSYSYDALNRLTTVVDDGGRVFEHAYDNVGNRSQLSFPNGVSTTFQYDSLNRVVDLTTAGSAGIIQSFTYTLGANGNRSQMVEEDGTVRAWEYDDLYRLTSESVTNSGGAVLYRNDFSYDLAGNRRSRVRTDEHGATTTTDYDYDQCDRLLSEGSTTYSWDGNGNLSSRAGARAATLEWDYDNRLTTMTLEDGTRVDHTYDHNGVRVRSVIQPTVGPQEEVNYLVDTSGFLSQVVAETDGDDNLLATYVRGNDLLAVVRPGGARFYHADGLGSIRALTDEGGAVTDRYSYEAFGELLNHTGVDLNTYLFAGEQLERASALYNLRARWMDPSVGLFASVDPIVGALSNPTSLHPYTYASGNPVLLTDPSGLFSLIETIVTSAIIGFVLGMAQGLVATGSIWGALGFAFRGMFTSIAITLLSVCAGVWLAAFLKISAAAGMAAVAATSTTFFTIMGVKDFIEAKTPREKVVAGIGLAIMLASVGHYVARAPRVFKVIGLKEDLRTFQNIPGYENYVLQPKDYGLLNNARWIWNGAKNKELFFLKTNPAKAARFFENKRINLNSPRFRRFNRLEVPMLKRGGYIQLGPFMIAR
jgi:RHS repeat-associated protein